MLHSVTNMADRFYAFALGSGNVLKDIWQEVSLDNAIKDMTEGISGVLGNLIPLGVTLMGVLAIPRIVKRLVHTFL